MLCGLVTMPFPPQARSSDGGFFQDNRPLDIVKVDLGAYGPANWIEE